MEKYPRNLPYPKLSVCSEKTCLLSFVIPMYNCEAYIGKCIRSITSQLKDTDTFEIIVIDDGSKDRGYEVVCALQNEYKNLRLLRQQNLGQSVARNHGLEKAVGKYIYFVDGDDLIRKHTLQNVMSILAEHDFDILSLGVSAQGTNTDFSIKSIDTGINTFTKFSINNGAWAAIFKKDFLVNHNIKFVCGRLSEDAMFTIDAFLQAQIVYKINADVYQYVRHPNSTTTDKTYSHRMKYMEDFMFVVAYMTHRIDENVDALNKQSLRAFCLRRDSFVFFLLMRILQTKLRHSQVQTYMNRLKALHVYPFPLLLPDYSGVKMRLLEGMANTPVLFYLACWIYKLLR